ncbi:hypothetical protein [Corynebacterium kozikiae]|uniref:hypothetical protein n=1 Tax=Corynebacterium kozikiae TaxID=2968469 RepID=UPI00211B9211|nr:hypothetical protein [Corynebacterium sp. 76QC2CO]MCQ9343646.1 hypothetical protein [Corynebacterium sp. 76QC2CO]
MYNRFLSTALITSLAALSACTSETEVYGPTWQVTDLYKVPGEPSTLPASVAGTVTVAFGQRSIAGYTGCAGFQATSLLSEDQLTITDLHFDAPAPDCPTEVHEAMVNFWSLATFEVLRPGGDESRTMILREQGNIVDPESIKLVQ